YREWWAGTLRRAATAVGSERGGRRLGKRISDDPNRDDEAGPVFLDAQDFARTGHPPGRAAFEVAEHDVEGDRLALVQSLIELEADARLADVPRGSRHPIELDGHSDVVARRSSSLGTDEALRRHTITIRPSHR